MAFLKAEDKQMLLDHYFDIKWCDDVADLRCVHCHRVAISHCVSNCKHIFCNSCRKFYIDEELQSNCPRCQTFITKLDDQDFDVEVKIHLLRLFCPNKKHGCNHEDQLRKIPSHLKMCVNTREAALAGKSSLKVMSLNVLIGELRETMGNVDNKVEEKFNELEKKTDDNDRKLNALTERMTSLEKKLEEELGSIKSLLGSINETVKKNEPLNQKKMEEMSSNVENKMDAITQEIEALQDKISEESSNLTTETYKWTINEVENKIQTENWSFESDAFTFIGYKCEIKAKLFTKDGLIGIGLQCFEGDTIINPNKNEFTTVKYIVRDQRNVKEVEDIIHEVSLQFSASFMNNKLTYVKRLPKAILSPPYTKDNCIKIKILLEPPSIDRSFVSNNGILKWRAAYYETAIGEGYNTLSPSFYTSPQGYRVKIRLLRINSKPLEVQVCFLTGEHDAILPLDFPHKTTVTLFNQTDPSKDLVNSEQRKDVILYKLKLEGSELIEQNGFVKDESLLLKVVIEPVPVNAITYHVTSDCV